MLAGCAGGGATIGDQDERARAVTIETVGEGTVKGQGDGTPVIECGTDCSHEARKRFRVELTAIPAEGARFVGWEGDADVEQACGAKPSCTVLVAEPRTYRVRAVFADQTAGERETCAGLLAQGIGDLHTKTRGDEYAHALRMLLCRTDFTDPSNAALARDVAPVFAKLFGPRQEVEAERQIAAWKAGQCRSEPVPADVENTYDLKRFASLELLQQYEQCQADDGVAAQLDCELVESDDGKTMALTVTPKGEGCTVTDIELEPRNAEAVSALESPEYLTASEDAKLGTFQGTFKPSDLFLESEIVVYAQSLAHGPLSCSAALAGEVAPTYQLGGTISGLADVITLVDGNGYQVTRSSNGVYRFSGEYLKGDAYSVSVGTDPLNQKCVVTNGSGVFGSRDITNVNVKCTSIPERVKVPAIGMIEYIPPHTAGDREYMAQGPKVDVEASLHIVQAGTRLEARIWMKAQETAGDKTTAEGTFTKLIYVAPPGMVISRIAVSSSEKFSYIDSNFDWDSFSLGTAGLVHKFSFVGDTDGEEAGIRTRVQAYFNDVYVDLLPQ